MTPFSEMANRGQTRVVKIGGSLFRNAGLSGRLTEWLDGNPDFNHLLICGGGELVDVLRTWQARHSFSESVVHWSAIRLMDEAARLFASKMPRVKTVRLESAGTEIPSGNVMLLGAAFVESCSELPKSWDTTSDSLSAEIARVLGPLELVLLKSSLPDSVRITEWVQSGYVDPVFQSAAQHLPRVTAVDLFSGKSLLAIP